MFDSADPQLDPHRPSRRAVLAEALWNSLTILTLLGLLIVLGVFALIFFNPTTSLNPFPPPTLPVALDFPTITPTMMGYLPPTWTPFPTLEPTLTPTPPPSATAPPTATTFSLLTPSPEPATSTPTRPVEGYPYTVQAGSPKAIANIAYPEQGCDWMGVAGQVFDLAGRPKTQLIVMLGGTIDGKEVARAGALYSLTGVAPQYGPSGYEFSLGTMPLATNNTLWIQLVGQDGTPLSPRVFFQTFANCDKNLILLNFKQLR
jgi:hypothetical protein